MLIFTLLAAFLTLLIISPSADPVAVRAMRQPEVAIQDVYYRLSNVRLTIQNQEISSSHYRQDFRVRTEIYEGAKRWAICNVGSTQGLRSSNAAPVLCTSAGDKYYRIRIFVQDGVMYFILFTPERFDKPPSLPYLLDFLTSEH
jgi:uncharacterized protein (DUF1684 family)